MIRLGSKIKMYVFAIITILSANIFSLTNSQITVVSWEGGPPDNSSENELDIDPYRVREEGCPIVAERHNLNLPQLDGNWSMPYASLNWLADIGMTLYNSSVKYSQITGICPSISVTHNPEAKSAEHAAWTLAFFCPKLKGEFDMRCWKSNKNTLSKFVCWNDKENRDFYLMIAATDNANWIVLVRCSPEEPNVPSEGMSWAILSKDISMEPDTSDVLFGLLDGYGFDVEEFKTQLFYDSCEESSS